MSTYIGVSVIFAYLLHNGQNEGIEISAVNEFIDKVMLFVPENQYFSFDVNSQSINKTLHSYQNIFRRSQNRIYRKKDFSLEYFNRNYPEYLLDIFSFVSDEIKNIYLNQ